MELGGFCLGSAFHDPSWSRDPLTAQEFYFIFFKFFFFHLLSLQWAGKIMPKLAYYLLGLPFRLRPTHMPQIRLGPTYLMELGLIYSFGLGLGMNLNPVDWILALIQGGMTTK